MEKEFMYLYHSWYVDRWLLYFPLCALNAPQMTIYFQLANLEKPNNIFKTSL